VETRTVFFTFEKNIRGQKGGGAWGKFRLKEYMTLAWTSVGAGKLGLEKASTPQEKREAFRGTGGGVRACQSVLMFRAGELISVIKMRKNKVKGTLQGLTGGPKAIDSSRSQVGG